VIAVAHPHLLIVGCGDIGVRVGSRLQSRGWKISAMRRQADQLPNAFNAVSGDYTKAADLMGLAELCPDYLLFTPTPTSRDESGYLQGFDQPARALSAGDMSRALRGAVMISSTRVFAEKSGGWVDEFSAIAKDDPCAEAIFSAEQQFMSGIPAATIFRASGLYNGSPTGHLVSRVSSGIFSADRNRYSNRIHREDLARAIEFALLSAEKGKPLIGCYVASDDRPSLVGEVEAWIAERLGVSYDPATQGDGDTTRGNRRCENGRLKQAGFVFRYPDYRAGYEQLSGGD
jgi:nucleoside-diphosphate-sugar epimerase